MLLIKVTIVGLCIIVPQYVNANSFNGYLVDNSGNVVVTPFGECVKSGEWSHSRKHHDCNQQLKSLAKTDHQLRSILEEMDGQSSVIIEVIEKTIKQINNISGESVEARDLDAQSVLADHHCDQNYQAEGGGHQYRVAVSLLVGLCEPVDNLRDEVRMLLRESIDYGYAPAMNVYGYLLVDGALLGYSDTERAFDYLHRAIKEDDLDAHYNLGFMYEHGVGAKADKALSNVHYRMSEGVSSNLFRLKQHANSFENLEDKFSELELNKLDTVIVSDEKNILPKNDKLRTDLTSTIEEVDADSSFSFPFMKN
ncbi:MAG: sel1 repeat family protein [Candidatus Marinimicrobia bacterium]|jgi:hypothetical protein|nr:sel1 repeat family protein [Candidatus Neomarinimicrobiota bacterium]MBT5268297.1 sel1 repeat family protein [Candidatus Neomarinimicrobiota bacterium]